MKKVIAAAGIGAAITVGSLLGAGTASATPAQDNYEFIQTLNDNGIEIYNVGMAIDYGRGICVRIANGSDGITEQKRLYYSTVDNYSWNGAYNYVGAAAEAFCPQFLGVRVSPAVW